MFRCPSRSRAEIDSKKLVDLVVGFGKKEREA